MFTGFIYTGFIIATPAFPHDALLYGFISSEILTILEYEGSMLSKKHLESGISLCSVMRAISVL